MKVLFITPPFVQWNTAYAAIPQLMAYIREEKYACSHFDLSIELVNKLFSHEGLSRIFENSKEQHKHQEAVLTRINTVIQFLQTNDTTLAHLICSDSFFPELDTARVDDLEWAFGTMGMVDKAKHLCTLFLQDIGSFIQRNITSYFGYNRYAESLAIAVESFIPIQKELNKKDSAMDQMMLELLDEKIRLEQPSVVGFTIPFPGNLYSALKCSAYIKKTFPQIKIILGGGYVNTEWRELTETAVFDYADFICLDDGEMPMLRIMQYLSKKGGESDLIRTYIKRDNDVVLINGESINNIPFKELPAPDYSGLPWNKYISTVEVTNPMHRLWSDGRWNKMTLAHGCYWHQCSFCDTQLDYIKRYEAPSASTVADKIERIIVQTGNRGFHFTDEAAPPKLLSDLADEILKRKIQISWWTNVRFEKAFSSALASKLASSGCIAVSGGLEVASDRILKLIQKGITIPQAAVTCKNFTNAGIMVHAYLMYGFPTQTAQETIDSLEIVRQLFENGLIQSGFWHRFTLTRHSKIAQQPEHYQIKILKPIPHAFASNDLQHIDLKGGDHDQFADGLKTALYNYMNGLGYEIPVHKWFKIKALHSSIPKDYISKIT